jgi:hypothetical protein
MLNTSIAGALAKRQNRRPDPPTRRVTVVRITLNDAGSTMTIRPETRDLARRLLIYETTAGKSSETMESPTHRVYEKLRQSLSAFAGVAGFKSLASRALVLARSEAPGLHAAQIAADGSLRGLGEIENRIDIDKEQVDEDGAGERGVVLIARLLGLLLVFLGEALTLSLLQVTWPGAVFDDSNSGSGRKA